MLTSSDALRAERDRLDGELEVLRSLPATPERQARIAQLQSRREQLQRSLKEAYGASKRFDPTTAYLAVQAAYAAYHSSDLERLRAELPEVELNSVEPFEAEGLLFGYTARLGPWTVLAFRGTDIPDPVQWLNNFDFAQTVSQWGSVHRGWTSALNGAWSRIQAAVQQQTAGGRPLLVTGHSRGGALAQLACLRLAGQYKLVGYTFGAPKPGMVVRDGCPLMFRVEFGNDIIPYLPPSAAFLDWLNRSISSLLNCPANYLPTDHSEHIAQLAYIDQQGQLHCELSAIEERLLDQRRLTAMMDAFFTGYSSLYEHHDIGIYWGRLRDLVRTQSNGPV